MESNSSRHSCLKVELPSEHIFVKATWHSHNFDLLITDGQLAWTISATEEEVKERACQWDQPVSEYIELAERYLGFQQPGSVYSFVDAGSAHKRLSWTFEKEGTKLEWRWKCKPSPDSKRSTTEIMDFLMDANIRLSRAGTDVNNLSEKLIAKHFLFCLCSLTEVCEFNAWKVETNQTGLTLILNAKEEVVIKTQSCERLKEEAEKCLAQSEKFSKEKEEFENAIFEKFVGVLNAKKAKLRELRDQLSKPENLGKSPEEEEGESTDKTETYNGESDEVKSEEEGTSEKRLDTSRSVTTSKSRGRKRK